ncbi:MAG: hypothetical protein LBD20_09340 [Spirochaetaceae bacterium]|jgi:hypothetical protein|nr:hypothetical protein [Spirochaetaceae bacterium]
MQISVKSLFRVVGIFMLVLPFCLVVILSTCDALNFASLDDNPGTEAENTDTPQPALPQDDPNATVHIYPSNMFTEAVVRFTNGNYSEAIVITSAFKTSFFSVPDSSHTIYEITLNPGNVSVLIGRNSGEKFHLEFDQNKQLRFRTDQEGNQLYPIPVGTYAELVMIRDMHDKTTWTTNNRGQIVTPEYLQAGFKQLGDIDLFGDISYKAYGTYKHWTPIGIVDDAPNTSRNLSFNGYYDGDGKKLRNMSIETNEKYQGLFAAIGSTGTVINLNVTSAIVEAGPSSAVICALNAGRIENTIVQDSSLKKAFVEGEVLGLGGICGTNLLGGLVIGSGFLGAVTATDQSGGICGVNNGIIDAVYFYGSVRGDPGVSFISEFAGINSGTIEDCFWYDPARPDANTSGKFSESNWPRFPDPDIDPEAGWAEHKQRNGYPKDGRWKKNGTLDPPRPGTPTDAPRYSNLPKLWWESPRDD